MTSRLYPIMVVVLWIATTGWLINAKVLPALLQGDPPDDRAEILASGKAPPAPIAWRLHWNGRPIGYTVSRITPADQDPAEIRTLVRFENLKLREVLKEFLGGFSFLADQILASGDVDIDLFIASRLRMDWEGELQSFETALRTGDGQDVLFVRGLRSGESTMRIAVQTPGGGSTENPLLTQTIALPTGTRFNESLSPRTSMKGLHVGQQWTTPALNPLSPGGKIRIIQSTVERRETIDWEGNEVPAFVIVYRFDSGGVGAKSSEPEGIAWTLDDGRIVRQEVVMQSVKIRLERLREVDAVEPAKQLEFPAFDTFFQRPNEGMSPRGK